eukprot:930018-Pleurochrysis_carterae.AAC.2
MLDVLVPKCAFPSTGHAASDQKGSRRLRTATAHISKLTSSFFRCSFTSNDISLKSSVAGCARTHTVTPGLEFAHVGSSGIEHVGAKTGTQQARSSASFLAGAEFGKGDGFSFVESIPHLPRRDCQQVHAQKLVLLDPSRSAVRMALVLGLHEGNEQCGLIRLDAGHDGTE